ncbi:hypothetical protein PHYBLDRAFT_70406 [Phycomyces blakesleeanus NRRL 1555(-)]|uniref:FAR1 domain-containing protein n=1 Tax=Phycomyces blakesleeanus (strain ATCC 8743b / DSM 1359 / FGSC 10004 / NBRC 33097 / NRRL 1555) TaxID=763407 RepID=A0A162ZIL8_PHYB8|nr:hypothetical protein PHYBLDRAFT_70406 [Phycomyces blakesleeanus NRRL 1555(-)]OAD67051.1 hypothetical protein PHYBLDRAFT_70406 [Phycomyces blakesleeanus NRRL 1555(-)]|eukprot:XP_018285091.1 hypothetical protein PHYBLDRAFT_70406 [Phycomyces blakesleeanus NRRL 1555(-)]
MSNINNINNTNDFVIASKTLKNSCIKLICKHSGKYRDTRKAKKVASKTSVMGETLFEWERKRKKDMQKHGCPCFMYANTKKGRKLTVRSHEAEHNHPIEEDHRAYAMYCKLSSETMALVVKHLENNDDVSTIFNSLKINGYTNIVCHDIANIKQHFGKLEKGKEMFDFITTLQDLDFHVRYSVGNTEDNQVNMVFFVHQDVINEAQRMPETVIIDATYKTNSHQMTYVNIVGTSNMSGNSCTTLKMYPIAGAWVEHETEENYL